MKLVNLLQLMQDVDSNYQIYFHEDTHPNNYPISKIIFSQNKCILTSLSINPRTIYQLLTICRQIKHKNVNVYFAVNNHEYSIFGMQIQTDKKQIILK